MTREEYNKFLTNKLAEVSKSEEYNIFCHMVSDSRYNLLNKNVSTEKLLEKRTNQIIEEGLPLEREEKYSSYKYGSINGKIKFLGNANSVKFEDIADYFFEKEGCMSSVILFAIPKYVKNQDKYIEFSSNKGQTELTTKELDYLNNMYKQALVSPPQNQCKTTVLDLVIERFNIPKHYILGCQKKELIKNDSGLNEEVFSFEENENHISKNSELLKSHSQKVVEKLKSLFDKYQTMSIEDLLIIRTKNAIAYNEDFYNEP